MTTAGLLTGLLLSLWSLPEGLIGADERPPSGGAGTPSDAIVSAPPAAPQGGGRSFLVKELVLGGLYPSSPIRGIPPGDASADRVEASPRPPGNYVGFEFVRTFTESSWPNRLLPDWLSVSAMNLHPRLVYDVLEARGGLHRLKLAPQDFWLRFDLGQVDRLTLKLGQFVLPYGANPVLAPRQQFLLPIEATDLGLKWDWGLKVKGPLRALDWEFAATLGSGEGLHDPHLFDARRSRFLLSGRLGTPTYRDLQYGVSFLYGKLSQLRGPTVVDDASTRRWRVAIDAVYKHGTYLMAGAQLAYGRDGARSPEAPEDPTTAARSVLGYRVWVDWVAPFQRDLRLAAQIESVWRHLGRSGSDDTAAIFEVGYSLSTPVTLRLDYRVEANRFDRPELTGLFVTLVYYAR